MLVYVNFSVFDLLSPDPRFSTICYRALLEIESPHCIEIFEELRGMLQRITDTFNLSGKKCWWFVRDMLSTLQTFFVSYNVDEEVKSPTVDDLLDDVLIDLENFEQDVVDIIEANGGVYVSFEEDEEDEDEDEEEQVEE